MGTAVRVETWVCHLTSGSLRRKGKIIIDAVTLTEGVCMLHEVLYHLPPAGSHSPRRVLFLFPCLI